MANLTAEITFPGGSPVTDTLIFSQSGATNMGDYIAPTAGFTQNCLRARNANLPNFYVDFRPDSTSGRLEVVFWNGEVDPGGLTVASGYKRDLPSYNVVIKNSGTPVYSATIPVHYWATRWRYQSASRSVIRNLSTVMSDGYMLPMSQNAARLTGNNISTGQPWSGQPYSGNVIQPVVLPAVGTYTPFMAADKVFIATTLSASASAGATTVMLTSTAGISVADNVAITLDNTTAFMTRLLTVVNPCQIEFPLPSAASAGNAVNVAYYKLNMLLAIETGGERPELGMMSEYAADYLLNQRPSSLNAILQQSEMAASEWPFYLSDLATGAPVNFKSDIAHYNAFVWANAYGGHYQLAYTNLANGWDFHENDSHFQMHAYIPYALTEDAYFLEFCQYMMQYSSGGPGAMLGREGSPTLSHGQYGWGDLLGHPDGSGGVNGSFTMGPYYAEQRSVGNGIRNLAMTYKVSPVSPPSWLLPKSYYASLSADYSKVIDTLWTTNPANTYSVFHMISIDPYFQAFEQAYAVMGMALADLVGMPASPSWNSILAFYFGMIDNLCNGTSGWNNQTPQVHDYRRDGTEGGNTIIMDNTTSWSALYTGLATFVKTGASFPNAVSPGNQQGGGMANCSMMYAAAACAKSRGVAPGSGAAFNWLNTFIDYNYPNEADNSMGIPFEMKCGFTGDTSGTGTGNLEPLQVLIQLGTRKWAGQLAEVS